MLQIDERLKALMLACGSGVPPDYMRFYIAVDDLLSSGVGPRSCCISLASHLKQVMTVIDEFAKANAGAGPADIDDATKQRLLVAFNGFKLLQGFIGHLPAEMRQFIATHAGVPTMSRE
jgi:hypothetical protein